MTSSLIIATYNWPQALELSLLSIARQHSLPGEVIIADDGSTSETAVLIERLRHSFPVPIKHIWHEDEGFRLGVIRNKAMAAASGEYLIQVDGDLILHPLFIHDHLRAARPGYFIGGSRVILDKNLSAGILARKTTRLSVFQPGTKNKFNGLHAPLLARAIGWLKKERGLYNMRGCNMSFWKKDIVEVNGYNETITGWGREDTELAIRLYNKGLKRTFFKLQGIVYHLYHPEQDRSSLHRNDEILNNTISSGSYRCEKGISQYI